MASVGEGHSLDQLSKKQEKLLLQAKKNKLSNILSKKSNGIGASSKRIGHRGRESTRHHERGSDSSESECSSESGSRSGSESDEPVDVEYHDKEQYDSEVNYTGKYSPHERRGAEEEEASEEEEEEEEEESEGKKKRTNSRFGSKIGKRVPINDEFNLNEKLSGGKIKRKVIAFETTKSLKTLQNSKNILRVKPNTFSTEGKSQILHGIRVKEYTNDFNVSFVAEFKGITRIKSEIPIITDSGTRGDYVFIKNTDRVFENGDHLFKENGLPSEHPFVKLHSEYNADNIDSLNVIDCKDGSYMIHKKHPFITTLKKLNGGRSIDSVAPEVNGKYLITKNLYDQIMPKLKQTFANQSVRTKLNDINIELKRAFHSSEETNFLDPREELERLEHSAVKEDAINAKKSLTFKLEFLYSDD